MTSPLCGQRRSGGAETAATKCKSIKPSTSYSTDCTGRELEYMLSIGLPFYRFHGTVFEKCQLFIRNKWYRAVMASFENIGLQMSAPDGQRLLQILTKLMHDKRVHRVLAAPLRGEALRARQRREDRGRQRDSASSTKGAEGARIGREEVELQGSELTTFVATLVATVECSEDRQKVEKRIDRAGKKAARSLAAIEAKRSVGEEKEAKRLDITGVTVLICAPGANPEELLAQVGAIGGGGALKLLSSVCTVSDATLAVYRGKLELRIEGGGAKAQSAAASSSDTPEAASGVRIGLSQVIGVALNGIQTDRRQGRSAAAPNLPAVLVFDLNSPPDYIAKPKGKWKVVDAKPRWLSVSGARVVVVGQRAILQALVDHVDADGTAGSIDGISASTMTAIPPLAHRTRQDMLRAHARLSESIALHLPAGDELDTLGRRCDALVARWFSWLEGAEILMRTCAHCREPVFCFCGGLNAGYWCLLPRDFATLSPDNQRRVLVNSEKHVQCGGAVSGDSKDAREALQAAVRNSVRALDDNAARVAEQEDADAIRSALAEGTSSVPAAKRRKGAATTLKTCAVDRTHADFKFSCKSCRAASRLRSWAKVARFERATSRSAYCGSADHVLAARTALDALIKRLRAAPRNGLQKTLELEREIEEFGRHLDRALRHERGEASASSDASSSSEM